ncbi:MAG: sulfite exporter TauE/SafE family protein [Gammaproteobacteria bacterium]|nr:sulfite exporter TauE/SafE family protein [Gammaproteobacteria bacterium]
MELLTYLLTGAIAGLMAGLLGVGGGLVTVPVLAWLYARHGFASDVLMHYAVGTSLAVIIPTSLSSLLAHHRLGSVNWQVVRLMTPGILLGALLGAWLAKQVSNTQLSQFFGVFMLLIAVKFIAGVNPVASRVLPGAPGMSIVGGVIGLVSALLGIGGGLLTISFLLRCKENIRMAVGTAATIGLPIAVAGTAGFIVSGLGSPWQPGFNSGFVYWPAVASIVLASVQLAPIGARLAHHLPHKTMQRVFALLLAVVGLKMVLGF